MLGASRPRRRTERGTGAVVLAAFASLGLPGLAGFVAEFQIFAGTFAIYPALAGVGLLGLVITAAVFLRMIQRAFLGALPERWATWPDLSRTEVLALAPVLALVVVIGVAPAWVLDVIDSAASALVSGDDRRWGAWAAAWAGWGAWTCPWGRWRPRSSSSWARW